MNEGPFRRPAARPLIAGLFGALLIAGSQPPTAALAAEATPEILDVIFESDEVRIYRAIRSDGRSVVFVTNIDPEGRRMGGEIPAPSRRTMPDRVAGRVPSPQSATREMPGPAAGDAPQAPDVQVIVNRGDGSRDAVGQESVQVTPSGDGTTVIINIDAVTPQPSAPPPVLFAPVVAVGGVPGPVRYPDNHPFLGYGPGISSPGFFGGLGLNAGNGFGLTKRPCDKGFDCMFGP